jgi:hypothetical protein
MDSDTDMAETGKPDPEQYEFQVPVDYAPPTDKGTEPFDQVCTLQMKPDGKHMCILKIGKTATGYKAHDEDKEEKMTKPDYSNMAQEMVQSPAGGRAY